MSSKRHGECRVRSTTPTEDRYIVLSAKKEQMHHSSAGGKSVSCCLRKADLPKNCCQTFEGRLRHGQHRTARLQWCREHHNWTEQDWACVLFSDESRFSLLSDCRHQLIWRESGTAYRPENIQEKNRYPTCSIMVWAGIMINGRTRLHVVANGTMTGQRYIDEVLLPDVRLFRGAVDSEGIQRLVWPARSPDLKPIENVWDALGRLVSGQNYPPTNNNTLIRALTEEWDKLPQQLLDNVVQNLNCLQENRLKVNSEREQDSPVEMGASNISRFKGMPFLKAKRHRAHSVVSGVRVKASKPKKKKNDPALRDYKRSTSSLESLIGH
ncbi:transposable element Tcb1 transposase [Trichonephila clavipes]|nr:transposable element Tcb1 transposase [Trichonephila clavipes]